VLSLPGQQIRAVYCDICNEDGDKDGRRDCIYDADSGGGIEERCYGRFFQRFRQKDESIAYKQKYPANQQGGNRAAIQRAGAGEQISERDDAKNECPHRGGDGGDGDGQSVF